MSRFSVWVGGVEINDYDINTREEAESLANFWRKNQGYDDVVIEESIPPRVIEPPQRTSPGNDNVGIEERSSNDQ